MRAAQGRGAVAVIVTVFAAFVVLGIATHDEGIVAFGAVALLGFLYLLGPGRVRAFRKQWRTSPAWHGERWLEVS